jgi:hypothetical protein
MLPERQYFMYKSCFSDSVGSFLSAIFPARNHRLLAFLLPKAAKGSKNALTPTS